MKKLLSIVLVIPVVLTAQIKWKNVDSLFQPLPPTVHVFYTNDSLDGKPNIAYYVSAELKDKKLNFTVDTTLERRFKPTQYFERNNHPLVTVNCTFFEFNHSKNLNTVIKEGKLIGYNIHSIAGKGKDTLTYRHPFGSAIGIDRKRRVDVAWLYTDSFRKKPIDMGIQFVYKDSSNKVNLREIKKTRIPRMRVCVPNPFFWTWKFTAYPRWKMQTAVGGGPVLLQNGVIKITNNEELKFSGKTGLTDKHPRTCMGYTQDGKLIIMVIQGRFKGIAEGATLEQEAKLLQDIGCWEALNLDGGGSSCMLVNGKETIKPSDKEGQRSVPCVFLIK